MSDPAPRPGFVAPGAAGAATPPAPAKKENDGVAASVRPMPVLVPAIPHVSSSAPPSSDPGSAGGRETTRVPAMPAGEYPGNVAAVAVTDDEFLPRARLVVIAKDGGEGASYSVGEILDMGRTEGDVIIGDDRYLSPRHARIVRRAGRLHLRDLGSTNGLYLRLRTVRGTGASLPPTLPPPGDLGPNDVRQDALTGDAGARGQGHRFSGTAPGTSGGTSGGGSAGASAGASGGGGGKERSLNPLRQDEEPRALSLAHPLRDQDLFLVGQQVLRFEVVNDSDDGLGPASQHGTLLFGSPATPRYARLCQRTVEGVTRDVFYIRKVETVLGRESGDVVFTEDPFLSRRHAAVRFERDPRRFLLTDLGSSNGTFVQVRNEIALESGDQFRIGQQLFRIDIS